jgi:hypothetical protein
MGLPQISRKGFPGKRVEAKRAGMTIRKLIKGFTRVLFLILWCLFYRNVAVRAYLIATPFL